MNETENWRFAAVLYSFRISVMISGDAVEPLCHICVIGRLSVMKMIRFPCQLLPQVTAAATIAKSSLKSMEVFVYWGGHSAFIHAFL